MDFSCELVPSCQGYPAGDVEKGYWVFHKVLGTSVWLKILNLMCFSSDLRSSPGSPKSPSVTMTSSNASFNVLSVSMEESDAENNDPPLEPEAQHSRPTTRDTQHTQPNWLENLIRNFQTEIVQQCSARTRKAVENKEVIEVILVILP